MENSTGKRAVAAVDLVVSNATGLAHLNIHDGDRVRVDPLAPVRPGDLVVIMVGGGLLLTEAGGRPVGEIVGTVTRQTRSVAVSTHAAQFRTTPVREAVRRPTAGGPLVGS